MERLNEQKNALKALEEAYNFVVSVIPGLDCPVGIDSTLSSCGFMVRICVDKIHE